MIYEIRKANINWHTLNKRQMLVEIILAGVFISLFSYFSIFLVYDAAVDMWQNVITIGYGLGDVIMIVTSFFLLSLIRESAGKGYNLKFS